MTTAGWIFLVISWSFILGVFAFCLSRLLRTHATEDRYVDRQGSQDI